MNFTIKLTEITQTTGHCYFREKGVDGVWRKGHRQTGMVNADLAGADQEFDFRNQVSVQLRHIPRDLLDGAIPGDEFIITIERKPTERQDA